MLPLRDDSPTRRTPVITYGLIALNLLMFGWQMIFAGYSQGLGLAMVPAEYSNGITAADVLHLFTSMFMHGGLGHIGGNMLYLWIFGDNVEDAMGSFKYLLFYLLSGVAASVAHILTDPSSVIPTVGASGAIAAVLGAYLVLYPHNKVTTLIILGYFIRLARVPAVIVLGLWFVLQLFQGLISLGGPDVGGVAFWAHIGGFVAGLGLGRILGRVSPLYRPLWEDPYR